MNDFLQQLRSGANKRHDKGRRPYDQYRGNDRNNPRDRKSGPKKRPAEAEQLHAIKSILQGISEAQKSLEERQAKALERTADALDAIAGHLKRIAGEKAFVSTEDSVSQNVASESVAAQDASGLAAAEEPENTTGAQAGQIAPAADAVAESADSAGDEQIAASRVKDRGSVLVLIRERKESGENFGEIARYLNENQIPTVTGKGNWRAQSVSRLYGQAS